MVKNVNSKLIYSAINLHINHFLNVKNLVEHDYESHMIVLTVYSHFLFQTIVNGKSFSWTEVFEKTETEEHKTLMKDRKLTIFSVAENLLIPQETVRRKLEKLCNRKLLDYSKSDGLSLGKKFKETLEPLGKVDGQDIIQLVKKFKEAQS